MGERGTGSEIKDAYMAAIKSHLANLESWTELLREVVKQYGPDRVWAVGLRVLEYPPTWVNEPMKAIEVVKALQGDSGNVEAN